MNSPTPAPITASAAYSYGTIPPSAAKCRRTLYLFEQDLEDVDSYYRLLYLAAAYSGKRMSLSKTDHLRTAFHAFVNASIRPELARLQASPSDHSTSTASII
jgi:hypothetical protein